MHFQKVGDTRSLGYQMSKLAGTMFRNRTAGACASHHRWNLVQKRREWKLPTNKLMAKLCAIPASHRGCQGAGKSTDGDHLRKMALPKIQYGSHVNCQPGEENREAITQREPWWPGCERRLSPNPSPLTYKQAWRRKSVSWGEGTVRPDAPCPPPGHSKWPP